MSVNKVGLFPGQGSQKVGMGKALCEASPLARQMFAQADEVLGFSLSKICFEGPEDELVKTEYVQPAIFTVSSICYALAREKLGGDFLSAAAGHSLGEYSALYAAGVITFEDGVVLVNKRGKYMQSAVPLGQGKMLAVLGKEIEEIEAALATVTGELVEIANINAPGQIVISGSAQGIELAKTALAGSKVIELSVSAPFHCGLMKPAAESLAKDIDALTFQHGKFPVYCNFSAQPVQSAADVKQALKDQVCGRVRWVETIQNIWQAFPGAKALEFGEGGVLSGLLKRIDKSIDKAAIASLVDLEQLAL